MVSVGKIFRLAPAIGGDRVVLGPVDPDFVARIGPVLRDERIQRFAQRKARLVELRIGNESRDSSCAIVRDRDRKGSAHRRSPRERASPIGLPARLGNSSLRDLNVSHTRGPESPRLLRAVGLPAMVSVRQRRPVECNERAPGEIVERRERVDWGRWHVIDPIGRDERRRPRPQRERMRQLRALPPTQASARTVACKNLERRRDCSTSVPGVSSNSGADLAPTRHQNIGDRVLDVLLAAQRRRIIRADWRGTVFQPPLRTPVALIGERQDRGFRRRESLSSEG